MKKIKFIIGCFLMVGALSSCADFLDRTPQDAMDDKAFFTQDSDLKFYMNSMYEGIIRKHDSDRISALNDGSDDIVSNSPHASLMKHSSSGLADETNATWNGGYDYIRKANYFLANAYRVQPQTSKSKHYIGEGYYCRASKYFDLLTVFGDLPYITEVLNIDSKELYRARDSRKFVATQIIADLDSAIVNLSWKNEGEAVSGRINKEAALVLKSRVALFEGSWEYYHAQKNTPFRVEGSDGKDFLQKAVEAGNELIRKYGPNVFKGAENNEYFEYFNQKDYGKIQGAFLYKSYSRELGVIQKWYRMSTEGFDRGLTRKAVDAYLMKDGKPASISVIAYDETNTTETVKNKDPRLGQTIWSSDKGRFYDFWPLADHGYMCSFAGIIQNQQRRPAYSGYRIWKGVTFDHGEMDNGEIDDLILRYEEALLNYAEAKAILGTITQQDLDKSVNVLRNRVNMAAMNLSEINGWSITYQKQDGYDPGAPNIVNEIRRERRVELMLEGTRLLDIKRWAQYDDVFNGWKPVGADCQEFIDYWNDPAKLAADGFTWKKPEEVKLTIGKNVNVIDGKINPFFNNADFKETSGRGYYIDPARDYLSSVPKEEITLYKNKANVVLTQNPGWF